MGEILDSFGEQATLRSVLAHRLMWLSIAGGLVAAGLDVRLARSPRTSAAVTVVGVFVTATIALWAVSSLVVNARARLRRGLRDRLTWAAIGVGSVTAVVSQVLAHSPYAPRPIEVLWPFTTSAIAVVLAGQITRSFLTHPQPADPS